MLLNRKIGAAIALYGVVLLLPIHVQAAFPLFEGFESGALSSDWTYSSSTTNGRLRFLTTLDPLQGTRHLALDANNYQYALNEVVLTIDLSGQTNVMFSCWVKDFYNDPEVMPSQFVGSVNAEGIAVSDDGVNWHCLARFVTSYPAIYSNITANLSAFAAERGLTLHQQFKIKFQQYDYFPVESLFGGYVLDQVSVYDEAQVADLVVTSSASINPAPIGSNVTFTITVSNAGAIAATDIIFSNRWPVQTTLVNAEASQGTWTTNQPWLVASLGTLGPGEVAQVALVVQPQSPSILTNLATVTTSTFDPRHDNNRSVLTILADNEGGDLLFPVASYVVDEGRGLVWMNVQRRQMTGGVISFDYETVDGSAVSGSDFAYSSGTLTMGNGVTSVTWSVVIHDDALAETMESLSVRLSNPTGNARLVSPSNAVIFIRDDDAAATVPFSEGFESSMLSNVWKTYTTGTIGPIMTISNQPRSGLKHMNMNGDFLSSSLNEIILNADLEGREGVYLRFWHKRFPYESDNVMPATFIGHQSYDGVALSVNGTNWYRVHALLVADTGTNEYRQFDVSLDAVFAAYGLTPNGKVQIKFQMVGYYYPPYYGRFFDDISLYTLSGSLRFGQSQWSVGEGSGVVTVSVDRVNGDSGLITVDYASSNGTASAGSDYSSVSGTLVFTNGQRTQSFTVPILQDAEDEPSESFSLHLTNPTGGANVVAPSQAEVVILDDDGPGEFVFSSATYVESESAGIASITVLRRYGSEGDVSVLFRTAAGTASPGQDYQETVFELPFADGITEQIVEIPLMDDAVIEGAETVLLFLENPQGGATLGDLTNAVLTLLDDEAPRAAFPFYEGFETAALSNYWFTQSTGNGRVLRPNLTNQVFELARSLAMDSTGGFALNEAILTVDLSGQTSAILRCWTRDFGDTPDPMPTQFIGSAFADGVAVSIDGQTWFRAFDLGGNGASTAYTNRRVDLVALAAHYNLPLTSTFQIKFQHYGNRLLDAGGRAFDHISISANNATSTVIRFQGFEGDALDSWDFDIVPKTGQIHLTSERAHSGNKSLRLIGSNSQNADPYLVFENVSIAAYNNVQLTVAYSALGPDTDDDLYVDISYDNGVTWNGQGSVKLVDGFSNANIPFGGVNPANPTTVDTNPWVVDIPDGRSQIKVRLRFDERSGSNNNSLDRYFVDHVLLSYQPFGQPPRIEPIGDRTAYVSNLLAVVVAADDIDHEPITLTASNLPPGAMFAPTTGNGPISQTFQFVPDESQAGAIYPVVFYATDSDGQFAETVTVRVLDKVVTFAPARIILEEGGESGMVTVRLSRAANAVVQLAANGIADLGAQGDYQLSSTTLVFNVDGPAEQVVTISVHDDAISEGLENANIAIVEGLGVITESPPLQVVIRDDDSVSIISANLVGLNQRYEDPGIRIMQSLLPDVIAIQEFNVTNAGGHRAFVDQVFGTNYYFYVEPGSLPNGVISRWPIIAAGIWDDPSLTQREFVWATLDVPGGRPLHVVSVHLYYSGGSGPREVSARALTNYLATAGFHPNDLVVVCGDMNAQTRNEMAIQVLKTALSDDRKPADQYGYTDTNQSRNRPYDYVLPHPYLNSRHLPVHLGGFTFPEGLVYDTRLWNSPAPPAPALITDSATLGMTHMAVKKLFVLDRSVTIVTQAGAGGVIDPPNPDVPVGSNQIFTITAAPYFYIKQVSTNKVQKSMVGEPTELVIDWSNVQANGWLEVTFAELRTPQNVPYHWLAGYGLTSQWWSVEADDDQDFDGIPTWQEYVADTDPTNPSSVFHVDQLAGGASRQIRFVSSTARVYTVHYAPDATWTGTWPTLVANLPGAFGWTTVMDNHTNATRVYRVMVHQP